MATYNGEKYIEQQLISILNQTKPADEVIIADDGSDDQTCNIILRFIKSHCLDGWKFYQNLTNLGYVQNFICLLKSVKGDIIFLSDQDDIWYPEKIETMEKIFADNSQILSLCSGYTIVDANEKKRKRLGRMKSSPKRETLIQIQFKDIIGVSKKYLGCTMCISKTLIPLLDIIQPNSFGHDWMLNVLASLRNGAYYIDRPLIFYRVHQNNTSGVGNNDILEGNLLDRLKRIENGFPKKIKRLIPILRESALTEEDCRRKEKYILKAEKFRFKRISFLRAPRLLNGLCLIWDIRWYTGWREYLGDLVYAYRLNNILRKLF